MLIIPIPASSPTQLELSVIYSSGQTLVIQGDSSTQLLLLGLVSERILGGVVRTTPISGAVPREGEVRGAVLRETPIQGSVIQEE